MPSIIVLLYRMKLLNIMLEKLLDSLLTLNFQAKSFFIEYFQRIMEQN